MNKTQKSLRLIAQELRAQRVLLEKLLDASLLQEASIRSITAKQRDTADLVRGLKVMLGEAKIDNNIHQRLQDDQLKKHNERLRALESIGRT